MGIYSCEKKKSSLGMIGKIQIGGFWAKSKAIPLRANKGRRDNYGTTYRRFGLIGIVVGMLVVLRWYEKKVS